MRTRSEYRLQLGLTGLTAGNWPDSDLRAPLATDRDALAALLLDAYRGTIDDEGEDEAAALQAADHYMSRCLPPYSLRTA